MSGEHSTKHIVQSLAVNSAIAAAKGVAAFLTGSGAMLAETLHSSADCGNQVLLLIGVKQAQRPPSPSHPLGHGRAAYFWSFMVALLLFVGGGVYSIYEGIEKILHPEPVERVWIGLSILGFSIALEGMSTLSNIKEIGRRRGAKGFWRYLRETKDSDLVVVFGENSAATLGLLVAMAALTLAWVTGDGHWDGYGSLVVGLVLVAVALFLAVEIKSLLVGEAADPEIEAAARAIAAEHEHLESVLEVITMQQGPGEVLVALKIRFAPDLTSEQVSHTINDFEVLLRKQRPEARWVFVEPDLVADTEAKAAS